uniref:Invertebrate defensins family profile domain-containing protein n=1 Tax=Anopheles darlingi TaxID=43151 RepID=A0A675B2Z6_ANODA
MKFILVAALLLAIFAVVHVSGDRQNMCNLFTVPVLSSIACKMFCVIGGQSGGYCNSNGLCTCRAEEYDTMLKPL